MSRRKKYPVVRPKRRNWDNVEWTPFVPGSIPPGHPSYAIPNAIVLNSIYQVSVFLQCVEPYGEIVHLSIKTHDRQPRHDWRELQRIKNEICGAECEGVEIFPAESRLVDTANQYHLYVFRDHRLPFGFQERLVSEESGVAGAVQRPFPKDARPDDLSTPDDIRRLLAEKHEKARLHAEKPSSSSSGSEGRDRGAVPTEELARDEREVEEGRGAAEALAGTIEHTIRTLGVTKDLS